MARRLVAASTEGGARSQSIRRSRAIRRSGRSVRCGTFVGPASIPDAEQPATSRRRRHNDRPDREGGTLRWCGLALQGRCIRCSRDGVSERRGARTAEDYGTTCVMWQHVLFQLVSVEVVARRQNFVRKTLLRL